MPRCRGGRSFDNDNLIIVCEGTETEYPYFKELCAQYPNYRVVPCPTEIIKKSQKAKRTKQALQLKGSESSKWEYYVGIGERTKEEYEKYRSEPTRWVRVAQLLLENKRNYEAWAVYDLDQGREKAHPVAYGMRSESLNIAFSAYSFEEWLLLHFERNRTAYGHSECKSEEDIRCGHDECKADWNCGGERCIAGRLRACKYIPDYAKKDGADLVAITKERRHIAYVNAAWSRSLSSKDVYERNPYTDVDKLVMKLLQDDYDIKWLMLGDEFEYDGRSYRLVVESGDLKIRYLSDDGVGVIPATNIYWCDNEYNILQSACIGANVNFNPQKREAELCSKPKGSAILCIKERVGKMTREYYFEINQYNERNIPQSKTD